MNENTNKDTDFICYIYKIYTQTPRKPVANSITVANSFGRGLCSSDQLRQAWLSNIRDNLDKLRATLKTDFLRTHKYIYQNYHLLNFDTNPIFSFEKKSVWKKYIEKTGVEQETWQFTVLTLSLIRTLLRPRSTSRVFSTSVNV